jgi:hypothetical protein
LGRSIPRRYSKFYQCRGGDYDAHNDQDPRKKAQPTAPLMITDDATPTTKYDDATPTTSGGIVE